MAAELGVLHSGEYAATQVLLSWKNTTRPTFRKKLSSASLPSDTSLKELLPLAVVSVHDLRCFYVVPRDHGYRLPGSLLRAKVGFSTARYTESGSPSTRQAQEVVRLEPASLWFMRLVRRSHVVDNTGYMSVMAK